VNERPVAMRFVAATEALFCLLLLPFQSWSDALSPGPRLFHLSSIRSRSKLVDTVNGSRLFDTVNGDTVNGQCLPSTSEVSTGTDNLHKYAADVAKVLKIMRPQPLDPSIPAMFRNKRLTFTNYWTQEDWDRYSSRRRFIRYIRGFLRSRLLRRVLPQLLVLAAWSALVVVLYSRSWLLRKIDVPLTSLSIVSTFVAALQTLRSNQGLNRLRDARFATAKAVMLTRDTALLFSTYIYPKDKELGLLAGESRNGTVATLQTLC
jgi:hypothetical protein